MTLNKLLFAEPPNGLRYWRWGRRGLCLGAGKTRRQKTTQKTAQNPTRPLHALLGAF